MKKNLLKLPLLLAIYTLTSGFFAKPNIRVFFCAWHEDELEEVKSTPDELVLASGDAQIFDQNNGQHYQYDDFMKTVKPTNAVKQVGIYETYRYSNIKVEGNIMSYQLTMFDDLKGEIHSIFSEVIDLDKNIITSTPISLDTNLLEEEFTEQTPYCKNLKLPDNVEILQKK